MGNVRIARLLIEELVKRIEDSRKYLSHSNPGIANYHMRQIEEHRHRIWQQQLVIDAHEKRRQFFAKFAIISFFVLLIAGFFLLGPMLNSFVSKEGAKVYSEDLSEVFNESGVYEFDVAENGILDSLRLSGLIAGDGDVKIYLNDLLIADDSSAKKIRSSLTGFAVEGDGSSGDSSSGDSSSSDSSGDSSSSDSPSDTPAETSSDAPAENPAPEVPSDAPVTDTPATDSVPTEPIGEINPETQLPSSSENTQEGESQNTNISQETNPPASENVTSGNESETEVDVELSFREFTNVCEETCNLADLNLTNSAYTIRVEVNNARVKLTGIEYELITFVPINLTENVSLIENITLQENVTTNETNVSITTSKIGRITVGKPVKWKKTVEMNAPTDIVVELPAASENIKVTDVTDRGLEGESGAPITGFAITASDGNGGNGLLSRIWDFFRGLFRFTGLVVDENSADNGEPYVAVQITDENGTDYEIYYETPAPEAFENNVTSNSKIITISALDELNYTDVLAYTELESEVSAGSIRLYHLVNESRELVAFATQDLNGNGLVDYVEWTVPHLSNQTYELLLGGGTFYDGFESGSFTTNNWTASGDWAVLTDNPSLGTYNAKATAQQMNELAVNISTYGYKNITFSYYASTGGSWVANGFNSSWWNGTAWNSLMDTNAITMYTQYQYNLSNDANNNSNLRIKFSCYPTNNNRKCWLDRVNVTGVAINGVPSNDTTPPASITNLTNQSAGATWIYWNWTNPASDFSQAIIYINGENFANTSNNYYNATLASNTTYTITVHTKDASGNANTTDVNSTARTLAGNYTGTWFNGTFFTGFESGSLLANNWTSEGSASDWSVYASSRWCYAGVYCAYGLPDNGLEYLVKTIDTTGYSNITFSYFVTDWLGSYSYCGAGWYNGTAWIDLFNSSVGRNYVQKNFSLPVAASNNPNFAIRFSVYANAHREYCYIDNVNVTGIPLPPVEYVTISDSIQNSSMSALNVTLEIFDENNTLVYQSTNSSHSKSVAKGMYKLKITPKNHKIISIETNEFNISSNITQIVDIDQINSTNYAINVFLENVSTTVTLNAAQTGNVLYKCANWNFTTRTCLGEWKEFQGLTPGQNYSIVLTPGDPGFYEASRLAYYLHNESDSQFTSYKQIANRSTELKSVRSAGLDMGVSGVQCWTNKWVTGNFSQLASINGTWNFTVYFNRSATTPAPAATLFARIFKVNVSGSEISVANTTASANVGGANGAATAFPINYLLASGANTNLSIGDRAGIQICMDVTTARSGKTGYIHWENTTTSNVVFPVFYWDAAAPTVDFVSPTEISGSVLTRKNIIVNVSANGTGTAIKNITVYLYNSTSALVNSSNSTTSPLFVNFVNLANGIYYFNASACDMVNNCGATETRNVTVNYSNSAPIVTQLILNSTRGTNDTFDDLYCYMNASDNDTGDTNLDYLVQWYRNGSLFGERSWESRFDGGNFGPDTAYGVGVDSQDNVYVTGTTDWNGSRDYYTVKYAPNGTEIWNRTYDAGFSWADEAYGLTVDLSDNIYVTGYSSNASGSGDYEFHTIKYNPAGSILWNASYGGTISRGYAVKTDSSNNVYVAGAGYNDTFARSYLLIFKYSPAGSVIWNASFLDVNWNLEPKGIAIDSLGNVYADGYISTEEGIKGVVFKFDSNGNFLWNRTLNATIIDDIAVDSSGNVYASGYANSGILVMKYDSNGNYISNITTIKGSMADANGIEIDSEGNIYVTGYLSFGGRSYYLTLVYNSSGSEIWSSNLTYGTGGQAEDLAIDKFGNIYVTGTMYFINGDYYTLKYNLTSARLNQQKNTLALAGMLNNSYTSVGDNWTCRARAYDGKNFSAYSSRSMTILDEFNSPIVNLLSPANNSQSYVPVTFVYNVSDQTGIANCSLIINSVVNLTNSTPVVNDANNTFVQTLAYGDYAWKVNCTDSSGNRNRGTSQTFNVSVVPDTILPVVSLVSPANNTLKTDLNDVEFVYSPTDNYGIGNCSLIINGLINQTSNFVTNGSNNTFVQTLPNGNYVWNVNCTDSSPSHNSASSARYNLTLSAYPPVMNQAMLNATSAISYDNASLTCYANATDINGGNVTYVGNWYKSGVFLENLTINRSFGGIYSEGAYGITSDAAGNIYVTGMYSKNTDLDIMTVKYDNDLNYLFNMTVNVSGSSEEGAGVVVDSFNNIYVAGDYLNGSNYHNLITLKYNSNGNLVWNKTFASSGDNFASSVAVDSSGNVYSAGILWNASGIDYQLVKYSSNGNLVWSRTYGRGFGDDNAAAVAVDSSNNVYITGRSSNGANKDYLTIKYDTNGNILWNKTYNGGGDDSAVGVDFDPQGNVYVAGTSIAPVGKSYIIKYNATTGGEISNITHSLPGGYSLVGLTLDAQGKIYTAGIVNGDYLLITYYSNGTLESIETRNPGGYTDYATSLAVDIAGNVFIAGYSMDSFALYSDWAIVGIKEGFIKGNQQEAKLSLVNLLNSSYTSPGDIWSCRVRAFDGYFYSDDLFSNNLYIFENGQSIAITLESPSNNSVSYTGAVNFVYVPYNNTAIRNCSLILNGVADSTNSAIIATMNNTFSKTLLNGNYIWRINCTDINGKNSSSGARSITVNTNRPTLVNVKLNSTYGTNTTNENLTCWANATDNDNSYIDYFGEWYVNGREKVDVMWNAMYDGGATEDSANGIAVDSERNVYVHGYTRNGSNYNYLTVKYDANGVQVWNKTYDSGSNTDFGYKVAVDSQDNVYIGGYDLEFKYDSNGNYVWNATGGTDDLALDSNGNLFSVSGQGVCKLYKNNNTGGDYTFVQNCGVGASEDARGVAVDSQDNVYVAGFFGSPTDVFVKKYNNSGSVLWTKTYNHVGASYDSALAAAVDSFDNVYVAGVTDSAGTNNDWLIIKYDSSGNFVWSKTFNSGSTFDVAFAITVNSENKILVAGVATNINGSGNEDYLIAEYDSNGNYIRNISYNSGRADRILGIATDSYDDIYVTGRSDVVGQSLNYRTIKYGSHFVNLNQTQGKTISVATADRSLLSAGQNWSCRVRAFDGSGYSDPMFSNNVTIIGAMAPIVNSPSDQNVTLGASSTISWNVTGGTGNGSYIIYRNGASYYSSSWAGGMNLNVMTRNHFTGSWNYTIVYNDTAGLYGVSDSVFVNVIDNSTFNCSDANGIGQPTLKNITIDGDMSDWDLVLQNPENYLIDNPAGLGDLDVPGTADRDIVRVAKTWNNQYLFFNFRRVNSGNNQVTMLIYLDYGNDGYMNSTDKVIHFVWFGSNSKYDATLKNYVPSNPAGDPMLGDGNPLPGSINDNKTLETGLIGGTNPGIQLETRVLWSDLGLAGPSSISFQPASALGSGGNLPSQLEDNVGVMTTDYNGFAFAPNNTMSALNGTSVYYVHYLRACGLSGERVELTNASTLNWAVTFYYSNGTLIGDSNSNGNPDLLLSTGNKTSIIARLEVPGSASSGTSDYTTLTATSSDDASHYQSVMDITSLGSILITPPRMDYICGYPGGTAIFYFDISNFKNQDDTLEVSASSQHGWTTTVYNSSGSIITDSDGDGSSDIGKVAPSGSKTITVKTIIPGAASYGDSDIVLVRVNSSISPSVYVSSEANITTKKRVVIEPNYYESLTGFESFVFYGFKTINCDNRTDSIDFRYTSLRNWTTALYSSDKSTLLTDSNSNGVADVGNLSVSGGSSEVYVKITAPTATLNNTEETILYGNSSLVPALFDIARMNTTAQTIVTYENPTMTLQRSIFEKNSVVYTRASSLRTINNVYFQWISPNNTVVKTSSSIPVTGEYNSDDSLSASMTSMLGNWTVIVLNAQNSLEIARTTFVVRDTKPPYVSLFSPMNMNYSNSSVLVNISYNSSDFDSIWWSNGTSNFSYSTFQYYNFSEGYHNVTAYANDSSNNVNSSSRFFLVDLTKPQIPLLGPANNSYDGDGIILFNLSSSDNYGLRNITLYINGVANQTISLSQLYANSSFVLPVGQQSYTWFIRVYDTSGNYNDSEARTISYNAAQVPIINYSIFNGNSTNWSALPDLSRVCNGSAILETSHDRVVWNGCVDARSSDFNEDSNLVYNNVTVLFGINITFNSSATITIRNLPWDSTPIVYRDGEICFEPGCSNVSYNETTGTAIFNVTHFTSYITGSNSNLGIWDESDLNMPFANMTRYPNQNVKFFANYTKKSDNSPITGATCRVNFSDSSGNLMTYNATSLVYEYNKSFVTNGTFSWNVTCSATGRNTLTTNDTVNISANPLPVIIRLYLAPAVDLNEGPASTIVSMNFTVYIPSGATGLNDSSAMVNFTRAGEALRMNTTCVKIASSGVYANYSCNVPMYWFDSAGQWNASAYIRSLQGFAAVNISNFTVNALTGFVSSPSALSWATVSSGVYNQTSTSNPILMNNTGNQNILSGNIQINATNLVGESFSDMALYAGNFSVGAATGGNAECIATSLSRGTFTGVGSAILPRGNFTVNDGSTGQEQLYVCLKYAGSEIGSQAYSTKQDGAWTIKILLVAFTAAGAGAGRKKKRKNAKEDAGENKLISALMEIKNELRERNAIEKVGVMDIAISELKEAISAKEAERDSVPVTIFSSEIGALEALCKYRKESSGKSYHEIAIELSRDDRTVWTACSKANEKHKGVIKAAKTDIFIPLSIFKDRNKTVLEAAIIYLKMRGLKFSEIGRLLQRDQRNVWTVYSRAIKK